MKLRLLLLFVLQLIVLEGLVAQAPDEYTQVSDALRQAVADNDGATTLTLMKRLQAVDASLLLVDGRSPVLLALGASHPALAQQLIEAYPALLETEAEVARNQVRTPFLWAVEHGDLTLAAWLVARHAQFDKPYWPYDRPEVPANALALSHDPAMTDYLVGLGLPKLYEVKAKTSPTPPWTANDNVNLRSAPDAKALVVGKLKKGETVSYFGNTTYPVTIAGDTGYWLKVTTKAQLTGWVFGRFVDSPWVGEE